MAVISFWAAGAALLVLLGSVCSFDLDCFNCGWYSIVQSSYQDESIRKKLQSLSEHNCLEPESDANAITCPLTAEGYTSKCLMINGTVFADTPGGTIEFRAKLRRCISVPVRNVAYEDGCEKDPLVSGELYNALSVVSSFGRIQLKGVSCLCNNKNHCNAAARLAVGQVTWLTLTAGLLVTLFARL